MKESRQTGADIPPPLWDKHLTNDHSCKITVRLWFCPRWWVHLWRRVTKSDPRQTGCTCTPTNMYTLLTDEKWKDVNKCTDKKGKAIHEQPLKSSFSLTRSPPTRKYEDIILLWLLNVKKGVVLAVCLCTCKQELDQVATVSGKTQIRRHQTPTNNKPLNASLTGRGRVMERGW